MPSIPDIKYLKWLLVASVVFNVGASAALMAAASIPRRTPETTVLAQKTEDVLPTVDETGKRVDIHLFDWRSDNADVALCFCEGGRFVSAPNPKPPKPMNPAIRLAKKSESIN